MPLNLDALIRLLVLVGLGMACALILQPFAEILLWAGLLAVILKPLQLGLQRHLRLGRWWSAGLIMLVGLLVLIGPVGALAAALLSNVSELVELVRHGKQALPQPPPLLLGIPVLGPAIKPLWHGLISDLHGLLRNHSDTLTTVMTRVLETTLAKGLGGGFPIGALAVKAGADHFRPGEHASTFGGNPLSCRAGLTVLAEIRRRGLLAQVHARGAELRALLGALTERHPTLLESSRGWGLLQGLVLREGTVTAPELVKAAIAQGLLLVPAGPRVVRFVPPLVIESTHLHEMVKRLELALVSLTAPTASVPFG
jgi:hypothetical protein